MMQFARGLLPPNPAKLARRLHASAHPKLGAGIPKGEATLEPCPRLNQRRTSLCHAHAAVAAVWTTFNAAGKPLSFIPSPLLLGSCVYADMRAAEHPVGPLPTLRDTGADLSDDAKALAEWGGAPMVPTRTDDGLSDVDDDPNAPTAFPNDEVPEPEPSRLQIAGNRLIDGEYQIPIDGNASTLCALSLDNGISILYGGQVNAMYDGLRSDSIATAACTVDGSGHAQYLSAYRTVAGKRQFRIQGSWGYSFADQGAVWADESYLMSQWYLWPMAVAS
jgi:hypothetical protein